MHLCEKAHKIPKKGKILIIIFGEYTHQMRNSARVLKSPMHTIRIHAYRYTLIAVYRICPAIRSHNLGIVHILRERARINVEENKHWLYLLLLQFLVRRLSSFFFLGAVVLIVPSQKAYTVFHNILGLGLSCVELRSLFVARRRRVSASRAVLLFVYASLGCTFFCLIALLFLLSFEAHDANSLPMNKTHGAHF